LSYEAESHRITLATAERCPMVPTELGTLADLEQDQPGSASAAVQLHQAWVNKAIGDYEQALVIAREIGDRQGEGTDLANLGLAYYGLGEIQKGIAYYEQALVILGEIGDRQGEGSALRGLGLAYFLLGEIEKASALLQQARAIGEQIREPKIVQGATDAFEKLSKAE
jgi:tetratricopeptide (TPR) repeat protein